MNAPSVSYEFDSNSDYDQLTLMGELTIYTVLEFKHLIVDIINQVKTKNLKINVRSINEIDSSGMQIFLFAYRLCQKQNISLSIVAFNDEIKDLINLYRLEHLFVYEPIVDKK